MHFAAVISAMGLRVYANKEREILILPTLMHYVCLMPVDQTHRSYASKTILMPDLQIPKICSSTHEQKFNSVSQKYSKNALRVDLMSKLYHNIK